MTRTYHVAGQLVQQKDVASNGEVISQFDFSYDAAGNITEEKFTPTLEPFPLPSVQMTYSTANRLDTYADKTVPYDADGNMEKIPLSDALTAASFDSRNRLTQVGNTVYRYDAENQRIAVDATRYVINPQAVLSQVLVKTAPDGTPTYYVYGLGLIGEETNGNYQAYHYDLRGSTVALTNSVGTVVDRFQYSAFAQLVNHEGSSDTPFLYNGRDGVMTDTNGLYYMRARYYSPEIRRFVNQDVLLGNVGDGQSLNRYAYVTGNPIMRIDPLGLAWRQERPLDNQALQNTTAGPLHHDRFLYNDGRDFGYYRDGLVRSDNAPQELLGQSENVPNGYRDDGILRLAERRVTPLWNGTDYSLQCQNCQHFANTVDAEYYRLLRDLNQYPVNEIQRTLSWPTYYPFSGQPTAKSKVYPFNSPTLVGVTKIGLKKGVKMFANSAPVKSYLREKFAVPRFKEEFPKQAKWYEKLAVNVGYVDQDEINKIIDEKLQEEINKNLGEINSKIDEVLSCE